MSRYFVVNGQVYVRREDAIEAKSGAHDENTKTLEHNFEAARKEAA